jgi:hypothetical protein
MIMSLKRLIIEEVSKLLAEDDQQDIYLRNLARKSLSDELYKLATAPIPPQNSPERDRERDRMLYSRYENWIQRFKPFEKLATQQGGIAVDHYHCSLMSGYFQLLIHIDSEETEENKSKEINILKNIIGEYGKCKIDREFAEYLRQIKKMLQEGDLEDFTKRLAELQGGSQTPTPSSPAPPAVPATPAEQVVTSSFKVGERVQWKKDPTLGCYKVVEIKGDKMVLFANNQKFEAKQTSYEKCRS